MPREGLSSAAFKTLVSRRLEPEGSREILWPVILEAWSVDHLFRIPGGLVKHEDSWDPSDLPNLWIMSKKLNVYQVSQMILIFIKV